MHLLTPFEQPIINNHNNIRWHHWRQSSHVSQLQVHIVPTCASYVTRPAESISCTRREYQWCRVLTTITMATRNKHTHKMYIAFWEPHHLGLPNWCLVSHTALILGLGPANERRRYFVTTSLTGWTYFIAYCESHITWIWPIEARCRIQGWF